MPLLDFPALWPLVACLTLVLAGATIQVVVGAGLSVVCGPALLFWLGPAISVPTLLALNLLVSVVATAFGYRGVRWGDATVAAVSTLGGCCLAAGLPTLPVAALKALTAGVLILVALPRPPARDERPSPSSAATGIGIAGLITGALTVWTATPGPITPVALARAGRSGADIQRTMQPVSVLGYGAALVWLNAPGVAALSLGTLFSLGTAALVGTGVGFHLRRRVDAALVVGMVRIIAGSAALLLLVSTVR